MTSYYTPSAQPAPSTQPATQAVNPYAAPVQYREPTAQEIWQSLYGRPSSPPDLLLFKEILELSSTNRVFMSKEFLPAMASMISDLVKVELRRFFSDYRVDLMEDDSGMYLSGNGPGSQTEAGMKYLELTSESVAAKISTIGDSMIAGATERDQRLQQILNAVIKEEASSISNLIEDVSSESGRQGLIQSLLGLGVNTATTTMGVGPVIPMTPVANQPPPPPNY